MVSNFQYLVTCMSFSIAKPYRKPLWTNYPYFISIVLLGLVNTYLVFAPDGSFGFKFFNYRPFYDEDTSTSYYNYRYILVIGIIINSIFTYATEKIIVEKVTKTSDRAWETKKHKNFVAHMEKLKYEYLIQQNKTSESYKQETFNNNGGAMR